MMNSMKPIDYTPKPITLTPEILAKCDGPDQGETFDRGVRAFLAVSKKGLPPSPFGKRKARSSSPAPAKSSRRRLP
jgi:hypothetical protein